VLAPASLSQILINLSLLSKSEGRSAEALTILDEAFALLPKSGYRTTRLRLFINRGILLNHLGQIEKARDCFLSAQKLSQDTGEGVFLAMSYTNLGHVYRALGNHALAGEFYEESLQIARSEKSDRQVCLAMEFLAENLAEQRRFSEALPIIEGAIQLASRLARHGDLMMETLRRRGEIYAGMGSIPNALLDLSRARQLCLARGEVREGILAERGACLNAPEVDLSKIVSVLRRLDDIGDRLEHARTVVLTLESGRFGDVARERLAGAIARAREFFEESGNGFWAERLYTQLAHRSGYERLPDSASGGPARRPTTNSSLYAQALSGARLAARSNQPALVLGETGSGKEVISLLIHQQSARKDKPFVAINCGALPENLFESELFGHVRGAFTGAERDKSGLLEMADGGTAFLDEVADLPPHTQVKLLRFLDCGELRRLGDTKVRKLDTRIIAATNKNLHDLVGRGRFREDLFYRLNVFQVDVPPLRLRREDIWPLAQEFLVRESHSRLPIHVSDELKKWMLEYDWPGNVRELLNLCRYLSTHAWGKPEIAMADLPPNLRSTSTTRTDGGTTFEREKAEFERAQILKALQETGGNISAAARLLGAGRNRLARRIRDLNIAKEDLRL
jgi:DNA-binding NtrC family response regulator